MAADKAKDVAAVAADKARETTEKTKISVAIAGEQREIEKNCRLIGEWFINEYEGRTARGRSGTGGCRCRFQGPHRGAGGAEERHQGGAQ